MARKFVPLPHDTVDQAIHDLRSKITERKNAVLLTGCAGNGKSKMLELLLEALGSKNSDGKIIDAETGRIVQWAAKANLPISPKIIAFQPEIDAGYLVPDEMMIPAFTAWYEQLVLPDVHANLVVIAGLPRSMEQNELMTLFNKVLVIHITASYATSTASILRRLQSTPMEKRRPDDMGGAIVTATRWTEFLQVTKPALDQINVPVLELDRESESLHERLTKTFEYLVEIDRNGLSPIRASIAERALNRLDEPTHPIHEKIRAIESPASVVNSNRIPSPVLMPSQTATATATA